MIRHPEQLQLARQQPSRDLASAAHTPLQIAGVRIGQRGDAFVARRQTIAQKRYEHLIAPINGRMHRADVIAQRHLADHRGGTTHAASLITSSHHQVFDRADSGVVYGPPHTFGSIRWLCIQYAAPPGRLRTAADPLTHRSHRARMGRGPSIAGGLDRSLRSSPRPGLGTT